MCIQCVYAVDGYTDVLVLERQQQRGAAPDPVRPVLLARHPNVHNKVSGVAGGGQDTAAIRRLVQRSPVVVILLKVLDARGDHVDPRARRVQNLGLALAERSFVWIPRGAVDVHAEAVHAIRGLLRVSGLVPVQHGVVKVHLVNLNLVRPSEVLLGSREERLGEEEGVEGKRGGNPVVDPGFEKSGSFDNFLHVRTKGLEARERLLEPRRGYLAVVQRLAHLVELVAH